MAPTPLPGPWPEGPGVVRLPSGLVLRARGLRDPAPAPEPGWGLYLVGRPPSTPWPSRVVRWRDFGLPADAGDLADALDELRARAARGERVELACGGGNGRTGTALACLAREDGIPAEDVVDWVRSAYRRRAIETPWQRRFARRWTR